jgi:pyrroloquinoline quinone biosynthesis protein B
MGHVPVSGPDGSLMQLTGLQKTRKIYTHMNNTNPLLVEDSCERQAVEAAGWEVAFDGMDLEV